jgi:alkylhydroperoxidase/carboxymuconolactone decarboxylase family protein YurZ
MSSDATELSDEQRELKTQFQDELGYWHEGFELLLEFDPEFLDVFRDFVAHPWKEGPLPPKTKALIGVGVNASPTTLHEEGMRAHIENAFEHGATVDEIVEVFELASVLGIHSISTGASILIDEAGLPDPSEEDLEAQERIRQEFKDKRDYWNQGKEPRLKIDHEHFKHYTRWSAHPYQHGALDVKTKELVFIAIDAAVTHTYESGLRSHIQNALEQGATREEILEALQLATSLGLHPLRDGLPILAEVAEEHDKL